MAKRATIGITGSTNFANYERWFADSSVDIVRLSSASNNYADTDRCDGVLLSGGEDIHPQRFGRPELCNKLDMKYVDEARDELEWRVVERALSKKLPVLAICRGMQLLNVYLGGSLIHDIPDVLKLSGHGNIKSATKDGSVKKKDQHHKITIKKDSMLGTLCPAGSGEVNSSHHQAIEEIPDELMKTATAEQEVVEALEWKKAEGKSWLLCVQWHPERMPDQQNPLARGVREAFLSAIGPR